MADNLPPIGTIERSFELNEKGQCPPCKKKPIPYKRDWRLFCCKCCRSYDMTSNQQQDNWAWEILPLGQCKRK